MTATNLYRARQEALRPLRRSTFNTTLVFIGLAVWGIVALCDALSIRLPLNAFVLWFLVEVFCLACYSLQLRHFVLGAVCFVTGLWLCVAFALQTLQVNAFLYLFGGISLIATALIGRRAGIILALLSTAYLLGKSYWLSDVSSADIWAAILLIWLSLFTSFAVFNGLYQALTVTWQYQDYAIEKMQEARQHRGELMQLTKALNEAKQELEQANAQLRYLRGAAEEARQLKAQFAANVSHELRTPINLIVGFSEMVLEVISENAPTQDASRASVFGSAIQTIVRNARHLQGLINDVLDISQIDAGKMIIVREELDLIGVVSEAIQLVRENILQKGLALEMDLPEQFPRLRLDRLRIRQVILNLLGNAIRFTDQGEIRVRISLNGDAALISIADTGIGISQEGLARVFDEFHQLENSLARRYGGSGLGLTLSKQFVELHGGQLRVESEGIPGKGSTFFVSLPLADQFMALPLASGRRSQYEASSRHVILYEDDPVLAQFFTRHTESHKVVVVDSLSEARRLTTVLNPTALVIDNAQARPELVAFEEEMHGKLPVITCSMSSDQRRLMQYGITHYLVKPVTYQALYETMQRLPATIQNVMVIDDDPEIVRLFAQMLASMPARYRVRKAYDGQEGLAFMRRLPPDLVILDLHMPGLDGLALVQHMKADAALGEVPIILASAHNPAAQVSFKEAGTIVLSKPTGLQPLEAVRCVEALVGALSPEPAR